MLRRPVSFGEPRVAPVQAHSERIEQRTVVHGARDFPRSTLIWKAPRLLWRARRCCRGGGRDRSARTKQGNGWRWRNHLRHWRRVHPTTGNGGRREDSRNDRDDNTGSGRWRSDVDADRSRCRGHQRAQSTGRRSDDGWRRVACPPDRSATANRRRSHDGWGTLEPDGGHRRRSQRRGHKHRRGPSDHGAYGFSPRTIRTCGHRCDQPGRVLCRPGRRGCRCRRAIRRGSPRVGVRNGGTGSRGLDRRAKRI